MAKSSSGGGIGIFGVLTIVFVVLKLTGNITWSWFWVLSPMFIAIAIWALVAVVMLAVLAIAMRK